MVLGNRVLRGYGGRGQHGVLYLIMTGLTLKRLTILTNEIVIANCLILEIIMIKRIGSFDIYKVFTLPN